MYKIITSGGSIYLCKQYQFAGDNIILDGGQVIAGSPQSFSITDLNIPPAPDQTEWLIDIGPFFDRFGTAKMYVLTSSNPLVKAVVQDVMVRKWIDLSRPDVAAGLDLIINAGTPGVDTFLKNQILTTPVGEAEKVALKKLFFND